MRKLNNRTIFFACISAMLGVVLSSYQTGWKILSILAIFIAFSIFVYTLIQNHDGIPKLFTVVFMLGFFVLGTCGGLLQQIVYEAKYPSEQGTIYCEVIEVSESQFVATNIMKESSAINKYLDGKVMVYYENSSDFSVGDVVFFEGDITQIPIFENGVLNYYFSSGITYRATPETVKQSYHIFSVKSYIKNTVYKVQETMFGENAGIAYAMTFGDTSFVEYGSLSLLRQGGVAHIFAVSGLHIGILYGLLRMFSWLKLRSTLKQKASFHIFTLLILFGYIYLCDFSASSMRAFLIILVSITFTRFGIASDRLSMLSVVAFILMLYSPYIIFTVGFMLSFLTVLGLSIFPQKIAKHLKFLRIKKLITATSIAISAFISTALVSCYYFGYLSTISVFLNLLIVPIYSMVYVANLFGLMAYGICSFFGFDIIIQKLYPYFTNVVYTQTIEIFSKIDQVIPLAFYIAIPACVVVAIHAVMYCHSALVSSEVSKRAKRILSLGIMLSAIAVLTLQLLPAQESDISFYENSSQVLKIESQGETYIFCKSGGEIDFSTVDTEKVHIIIYDNYYKDMTVSNAQGYDISIYAEFLSGVPAGANTLDDFQNMESSVTFSGVQTVEYQGVSFLLGDNNIEVFDGIETREITSAGAEYYIIDGVFTTDPTYSSIR